MSPEDAEAFEARFTIQSSTGANEAFVGNGLTTQLDSDTNAYGALETFVYDRDPQPISKHIAANQVAAFASELRPTRST